MAANKLNNGFLTPGESLLVSSTDMNRLRDACTKVQERVQQLFCEVQYSGKAE